MAPGKLKELFLDPITRLEGHIGARVVIDTETRRPVPSEVRVFVTMFRGFEVFLRGRPPEDAIHITSRICGVCGASHANASTVANDMALGVTPEPLGVALRNMAFGMTDHIYDHPLILNMLGGADYSAAIVGTMTPKVWKAALETTAEYKDRHGFKTIAEIMEALNPITGKLWQLTIKYQRIAREAGVLLYGRHSHPSTLIPGGITTDLTNLEHLLIGYVYRLVKLTAWAKYLYYVWLDLKGFMEEHGDLECPAGVDGSYKTQGSTAYSPGKFPPLVSAGLFDDPEEYAAMGDSPEEIYGNIDKAFFKRVVKPGAITQGSGHEFITQKYTDINVSIMERVDNAFYDAWEKPPWYVDKDYNGTSIFWGKADPLFHPWNKTTVPKPGARDWASKYSWAAVIRYVQPNGAITPMEVGPIARMVATAYTPQSLAAAGVEIRSGNGRIEVTLPKAVANDLPPGVYEEDTLVYEAPAFSTTLERVWARAYNIVMDIAALWYNVVWVLEYLKRGGAIKTSKWDREHPRRRTYGVGLTEAPRGAVRHWLVQEDGKIVNYQIHAPTTGNVSPLGSDGLPAPFEASVRNSVVTEAGDAERWTGLDFVRAVRSFDPCLACAVHMQIGKGRAARVIKKLISPTFTL